jgi:hypothetical protein
VALCASSEALPFAGTRFRERLTEHAGDVRAQASRDRVVAQALAIAQATRATRPAPLALSSGTRWTVSVALVLALLAGSAWFVSRAYKTVQERAEQVTE